MSVATKCVLVPGYDLQSSVFMACQFKSETTCKYIKQ